MIDRVQSQLEAIYEIECHERAEQFVVDDVTARQLGATGRTPEELLVGEGSGDLELALYLDPKLLERMKPFQSPIEAIDHELEGYCQIAEGVSHFIYLARAAAAERHVSLLELEAQAEIDKFALCLLQRWGENMKTWGHELIDRLFNRISFNPLLSKDERWRYEEANRLSKNFCTRLFPLISERRLDRLLSTLRYAYRLGAEAKLQHLAIVTG